MRRVGERVRVISWRAVATLSVLLILSSVPAIAGDADRPGDLSPGTSEAAGASTVVVPSPPRLVYADTDLWTTDLFAAGSGSVSYTDCFTARQRIDLDESRQFAIIPDFSRNLCFADEVGLAPLGFDGGPVDVETFAYFYDESTGDVASFVIPVLEYALPAFELRATGIQSDADFVTSLVLFNEGNELAPITAVLYGAAGGAPLGFETIEVPAGGWIQHVVSLEIDVGRLDLVAGYLPFGFPSSAPVYGFAAVTWRRGGSPRIVELKPILP